MIRKTAAKNSLLGLVIVICISAILYQSCYWDNEEYLYPTIEKCDTSIYNYSGGVVSVLSTMCLSCHANNLAAANGGNIKLGTYADVKANADNGKLLGSIKHQSGFSPMPKGSARIDACKITIIEKWVSVGAPNN